MCKSDFHIHTTFSDGVSTPEEIVLSAIDKGMKEIGFSDHSFTLFDKSYCIKEHEINEYIECINKLKAQYSDKIKIHLGIEQDYYSDLDTENYDYIIGSVHYIKVLDTYIPVDESADILLNATNDYFNGNIYELIDAYYHNVADIINKTNADIIGHIDLITKFNENSCLFNENDERYKKAYKSACDSLLRHDKYFEINTGAISRGYRTSPYPSDSIYEYLKSKGAKFILSSDSHHKDTLCYKFDNFKRLI